MSSKRKNGCLENIHNHDFENEIFRLTVSDLEKLSEKSSEFVDRRCPACGSGEMEMLYKWFELLHQRCNKCGTVYINPCPTEKHQACYHKNSEALKYWRENMPAKTIAQRNAFLYEDRCDYICSKVKEYTAPNETFLEIGAGNGELAKILADRKIFNRLILIEPQPLNLNAPSIEVVNSNVEDYETNEKISVIALFEVIEHIVDPDDMLNKLYSLLAEDGIIVISTPNSSGLEFSVLKGSTVNGMYDHVCLYNTESLTFLLEKHGFEIIEIETPGVLDVEIIHRAYEKGDIDLSSNPALFFLMEDAYKHKTDFQDFLRRNKLSGHMKCIVRKK